MIDRQMLNWRLLINWVINAASLLAVPYLIDTVQLGSVWSALIAAAILGLVNTLIRPILLVLTLPVTFVSLGLFVFVINGLLFWLVAQLVKGFYVAGFWSAICGALLYSIISWALNTLLMENK